MWASGTIERQAKLRAGTDRRTFLKASTQVAGLFLLARGLGEPSAGPSTYYVSAIGANSNDGLSPSTPWRDLTPVNGTALAPGNTILFRGGDTFTGGIYVDGATLPPGSAPIVFASYGGRRASLTNSTNCAIYVYNPTCGIRLSGLNIVGPGAAVATTAGVLLYRDRPGRSHNVRVNACDAVGWTVGVSIGGWAGGGFDDVRVTNTVLTENRDAGLAFFGAEFVPSAPVYANTGIYVGKCQASNQLGNPANITGNSGSGIILGSVDGGTVEGCTAFGNGSLCTAPEGPVGIWAYDSNNVTLTANVSYQNETGGTVDGGGFDLDVNCSNSTIQYNLAYSNAGPGILLYSGRDNSAHTGNVVRYNMLWGNAAGNAAYGELHVAGSVRNAQIYNNTMVAGGSANSPAVSLREGISGVRIRNNILLATGTGPVVKARDPLTSRQVLFQGNSYHSTGSLTIAWAGTTYPTVAGWASARGQEVVDGRPSAVTGDPLLVDPTVCPAGGDTDTMKLRSESPLREVGLPLPNRGARDYFGYVLSSPVSVGGHEHASASGRVAGRARAKSRAVGVDPLFTS